MSFPIAAVIMAALINPSPANDRGDDRRAYQYDSVSDTSMGVSRIMIDIAGNQLVYPATLTPMQECPRRRKNCFATTRMSFCSPSNADIKAGAWNCGSEDLSFKTTGSAVLRILGENVETLVISNRGTEYFYSQTRGVVMFRFTGQQVAEVYWSTAGYGFGAER